MAKVETGRKRSILLSVEGSLAEPGSQGNKVAFCRLPRQGTVEASVAAPSGALLNVARSLSSMPLKSMTAFFRHPAWRGVWLGMICAVAAWHISHDSVIRGLEDWML